ncbi:hypothetical protein FRC08_002555 [Ceratobasidium sp. 394]|nr:hypothetical protein FRC08_002555 [Ceratobasidium sp. 394]
MPTLPETVLVDSREIEPEVRDLVPTSDKSCNGSQRYYALQFSLKHEVEVVVTHLRELQLSSEEVLQSWIQARKLELARQEEHTDLVTQFLTTARRNRTKELKRNWHEQVEQRLLALGWSQNEADLPREKQGQWRPLASRAQVLTEESWSRLEPVILGFLTTEAEDRVRREREQRSKILEGQFHGLQNDMDTLPDPIVGLPAAEIADTMAKWLPIPQYVDALEWPMIRDLLETDVSEAHMVDRFKQHRDEIILLITNWGRQVKREWASILREGRRKDGLVPDAPRPRLPASGAGRNLLEDLDPDTCLLLRADSIFAHRDQSSILSYDILMRSIQHGFNRFTTPRITRRDLFDLTAYTFHSEASGIARALLASLGQQDASVPEFNVVFGRWFLCGRCGNRYRMSWMCMVKHYLDMNREYWNKVQPHLHKFSELGIAFKNRHALQSEDTRPLVIYLSGQEIDILVAKNRRFIRLTSWTEQTTEELAVLPPATATNVEDKVDEDNFQDDEDEDDEDEDEDEDKGSELAEYWNRDRLGSLRLN